MQEPKKGKYDMWYIPGINCGFTTRERAIQALQEKEDSEARQREMAEVAKTKPVSDAKFLGYKKAEWVASVVIGIPVIWGFLTFLSWMKTPSTDVRPETASRAEISECKDRIKNNFRGNASLDMYSLTGVSSDKLGPGGTSRVRVIFTIKTIGGVEWNKAGICHFSPDAPLLSIVDR